MYRSMWIPALVVAAAGTGVTALLLSQSRPSVAQVTSSSSKAARVADVQVRHEFVTLQVPASAPGTHTQPSQPATISASASAAVPRLVRRTSPQGRRAHAEPAALLSRVGRAVAGDGRHRPEPFPRIK